MTGQIVTHLMTPLFDRGHHLFADRYYSGVNLVTELYRRNTGFTGTIMPNRVKLPPAVRGLKLEKGDITAWEAEKMLVLAWKDKQKNPNILISSVSSAETVAIHRRHSSQPVVDKPVVVHQYNHNMNGVDKADQNSVYNRFERRSAKWWRKLFFWLLEVSIVNSYCCSNSCPQPPYLICTSDGR